MTTPSCNHEPLPRLVIECLGVTVVATILFGLLTWPWPLSPDQWVIGDSFNDQHALAWTLSWVANRMRSGEVPWGYTNELSWPDGGTLFPADLLEAMLVAPITLSFGAFAALGALTILHHSLAAGTTWGWLRSRSASPSGAAAGALIVSLAPPLVTSSWNGNPDVTGIAWVTGALWAAEQRRHITAGFVLGCGALSNPYVAVIGAGALGLRLVREPQSLLRVALPAAALAGAAWVLSSDALAAPDALIARHPRGEAGLMGNVALPNLLLPWPEVLSTDPDHGLSAVGTGGYLGLVALTISLFARRNRALGWSLVTLGVVAALGPELRLSTDVLPPDGPMFGPPRLQGTGIPLPWALAERLGPIGLMHQTARFGLWSALGLAVLVSSTDRMKGHGRWLLPLLVLGDLVIFAAARDQLKASERVDTGLCDAVMTGGPGAVLHWPPTAHEPGLAAATCHAQPVAEAINRPIPRALGVRLGPPEAVSVEILIAEARGVGFRWLAIDPVLASEQHVPAPDHPCSRVETDQLILIDLSCTTAPKL